MDELRPDATFTFAAEVWLHPGGTWHFVALPEEVADDIEELHGHRAAGFGSLKVDVTVGSTSWSTSIFPDAGRATYVLPIKKLVRTAEDLGDGATAEVHLRVVA